MGTKFKGQTFVTCSRNGVKAIARWQVRLDVGQAVDIETALIEILGIGNLAIDTCMESIGISRLGKPIFTFAKADRVKRHPWFTGNHDEFDRLVEYLRSEGATVSEGDLFVPFSNAAELGHIDVEAQVAEFSYVTTSQDFYSVFGFDLVDLD